MSDPESMLARMFETGKGTLAGNPAVGSCVLLQV